MWRVRTAFTGIAGSPYLSTAFFSSTPGTPEVAHQAVFDFWDALSTSMVASIQFSVESDVFGIDPVSGQPTTVTSIGAKNGAGASSAELLPLATQGLIRWSTGVFLAGREIRGRTFIPGLTELASAAGVPVAAQVAALDSAATELIGLENTPLVIWSRARGQEVPVSGGSGWNQWAVLRSRRD